MGKIIDNYFCNVAFVRTLFFGRVYKQICLLGLFFLRRAVLPTMRV